MTNLFVNTPRWMMKAALAALVMPAAAAYAAPKPTIVLVHRNIQKTVDEQNWKQLAINLADDGYRVLSYAMASTDSSAATRDGLVRLLSHEGMNEKLVVVSTAAASDMATMVAESEPERVKAVVYISAEPSVATLGPRSVEAPADLAGKVPVYQVKITSGTKTSDLFERGATTYRVREEGTSTLPRVHDLEQVIETVAVAKPLPAPAAKPEQVASLR
jgi:pimeloyl-ACP methyl ester carboxylesterase